MYSLGRPLAPLMMCTVPTSRATLILDDKTVGRHYAGPTWEDANGSAVTGKAISNAPGATSRQPSWMKAWRRKLLMAKRLASSFVSNFAADLLPAPPVSDPAAWLF
jgi:hypothetical protein